MSKLLIINPDVYTSDPQTLADLLGITEMSIGMPSTLREPTVFTDIRDGTNSKALIQLAYDTLVDGWFVIRTTYNKDAPLLVEGDGIAFTWISGSTFGTGSLVTDSGVAFDPGYPLSGDSSYAISGGKLGRVTDDAASDVTLDVATSRGTLVATFTALPRSGSALLFRYIDSSNFWQFVYMNPGWRIEQYIDSTLFYSSDTLGDTSVGVVSVSVGPTGITCIPPNVDNEFLFVQDIGTETEFGLILRGNGTVKSEITDLTFTPQFQITYYQPVDLTASEAIPPLPIFADQR